MKLYFYRGTQPNFGDELNNWLIPKIFPNFFDDNDDDLFLAIGSVLHNHHPEKSRKIVFGSGYAGYTPPPKIDDRWAIYSVRGPRTADALGLDRAKVAADAAIVINQFQPPRPPIAFKRSFIPHWESIERGHWPAACRLAGIHFIDPRLPVDEVLSDILKSEVVITEAMHGAIVSDALRVPWIPVLPIHAAHHFKWFDWAEALNVNLRHHRAWPTSVFEAAFERKQPNWADFGKIGRTGQALRMLRVTDPAFISLAALRLGWISRREPTLSSDRDFERALDHLMASTDSIKHDHASGVLSA